MEYYHKLFSNRDVAGEKREEERRGKERKKKGKTSSVIGFSRARRPPGN